MFHRLFLSAVKNPVWQRVVTLSLALFFISTADALISFWSPNLIQNALNSPLLMGIVIGFQSMIGFLADLIFPNLLKKTTVRRLVMLAIIASLLTLLCLVGTLYKPFILIFLLSMTFWGIYYELIGFASYQFVSDAVPLTIHAGAWGVMGVFRNLAYFLGPLLGAFFLMKGNVIIAFLILLFLIIGLVIINFFGRSQDRPLTFEAADINLFREMKYWKVLFKRVWPIITISLLVGCIDATFWTTGAVWTQSLVKQSAWGSFLLPFYALPALFIGFFVAKSGIYKGKKKKAEIFLLLSGLILAGISLNQSLIWILVIVFVSSSCLAVTCPLVEGVYSDINARMGEKEKHLIGLTGSIINLSYIVWPVIAGFLSGRLGERMTFTIVGVFVAVVSLVLLSTTPRKLKVPQTEVKEWK